MNTLINSTLDLHAAFQTSGLWRTGWTFQRALCHRAIRLGLQLAAEREKAQAEKQLVIPPEHRLPEEYLRALTA